MSSKDTLAIEILDGVLEAMTTVIPLPFTPENPQDILSPVHQREIGVLIGFAGNVNGRLIIDGDVSVFADFGQAMFGMAIEGEMLSSFVGELGNMIAGNAATNASNRSIQIDITPPTVIQGEAYLSGFGKAVLVNMMFDKGKKLRMMLAVEDK